MPSFATIYPQSVNAEADNGVLAGVFIPIADLYGIVSGELAENQAAILKEGKSIYGVSNALKYRLPTTALGITITKSPPTSSIENTYQETITLNFQWVTDFSQRTVKPVPLPTSQLGKVAIADLFPNASLITAEGAIPGEGLLFTHATANNYGAVTPNSLIADARDWAYSLFLAMCATCTVRITGVESAIYETTKFETTRNTGIQIPTAWYDPSAPLTGIIAANLPTTRVNPDILKLTYEVVLDPMLQKTEVRVVVG